MKCVMLSIRPKYCELIASGKKTVEVRRTKPKIDVPFKCYIYCTKGDWLTSVNGKVQKPNNMVIDLSADSQVEELNGKVIGDFVCKDIMDYLGNGVEGYAWLISDLVIYDKPKELSEFRSYNVSTYIDEEFGLPMPTHIIKRPPQSYMFVEELKGETE